MPVRYTNTLSCMMAILLPQARIAASQPPLPLRQFCRPTLPETRADRGRQHKIRRLARGQSWFLIRSLVHPDPSPATDDTP
ncbi:hypothetical protein B0H66DRAFT_396033 [Apodospora peruviana]|uniref:Secreted protein n=1 Tax=Apodospora peruviana TaxID=516989 RepID=A0AAE0HTC1_9PEZI|nr:hypothetical protein B0H66DRAFT_396033 [Apodospora peruviana]